MRYRKSRTGFTLIELLVVIAIIAILAAILFPIFVAAKAKANTGKCQGHQRQLLAALMLYVEDYSGRLPRCQFLTDGEVGGVYLSLYKKYVKNYDILRCPGEAYRNRYAQIARPAFAYNEGCLCAPLSCHARAGGLPTNCTNVTELTVSKAGYFPNWPGRPMSDVATPSKCPAFFCSESYHTSAYTHVAYGYGWQPEDIRNNLRMINPHNGGTDYAFLDGHVKWYLAQGTLQNSVQMFMRTDGIDYDGNGTVGDAGWMR